MNRSCLEISDSEELKIFFRSFKEKNDNVVPKKILTKDNLMQKKTDGNYLNFSICLKEFSLQEGSDIYAIVRNLTRKDKEMLLNAELSDSGDEDNCSRLKFLLEICDIKNNKTINWSDFQLSRMIRNEQSEKFELILEKVHPYILEALFSKQLFRGIRIANNQTENQDKDPFSFLKFLLDNLGKEKAIRMNSMTEKHLSEKKEYFSENLLSSAKQRGHDNIVEYLQTLKTSLALSSERSSERVNSPVGFFQNQPIEDNEIKEEIEETSFSHSQSSS